MSRSGKHCIKIIFRIPQLHVGFYFLVLIPLLQRWFFTERSFSLLRGLCEVVVLETRVDNRRRHIEMGLELSHSGDHLGSAVPRVLLEQTN